MEPLKISEIAKAVEGTLINSKEDITFKLVSTAAGVKRKGYLYVYLTDDPKNCDPTSSVEEAIKNGAAAILVPKKIDNKIPQIIVQNSKEAFRALSKYYKSKFNIPVIAVTGTSGKTTTKDIIASVLDEKFNVHKTKGNFNGLLGVPITAFQMNKNHEISVVEIGMTYYGHIERMVDIIRPSIGIITNIGTAHIGNFGSRENILKAKMEITTYFDKYDILIINGDDKYLSTIEEKPYKIIKISTSGKGDYNARDIVNLGEEGMEFKCNYKGVEHLFKTKVPGLHNVYNALFAIAIGELFGVDAEQVKNGIMNFIPEKLRMNILKTKDNVRIILDCYTAELESMKAGIDVLNSFHGNKKIAVLGDMFGHGNHNHNIHMEIGKYVFDKCDLLITIGNHSKFTYAEAKGFVECIHFENKEEACLYLKKIIEKDDVVLINGGRLMKLETIAAYLMEDLNK